MQPPASNKRKEKILTMPASLKYKFVYIIKHRTCQKWVE